MSTQNAPGRRSKRSPSERSDTRDTFESLSSGARSRDPLARAGYNFEPCSASCILLRFRRRSTSKNPLRANSDLTNHFKVIWVVQSCSQKYSAFHLTQISGYFRAVSSRQEGRIAIVTNAGRDAVDAAASGAQMVSQGRFIL
ncbi:hypothetical protein IVB30_05590 [Bradyrhizobium sp. 200]|uniref:hypothetical protein n=1 Tax=Bradyrhizobium sp. 200 TaxID=2782665 RepID=UPI001FFF7741|nr:hypothetical protein [Bradyrhizobium sp. 200]UPJ50869.1 hypothetical protein IVB30_05590 [Bradyrhizobium sp. 200]